MARVSKKQDRNLKRSGQTRHTNEKVLIVCEGEKTEPYYLEGLIAYEKLSSVNRIQIEHTNGRSAPIHVVNHAIELESQARQDANQEAHYDRVYCVFDQDSHSTLQAAMNKLSEYDKKTQAKCQSIVSYPSFEYWYLCHFRQSRAPIVSSAVCEQEISKLWRTHFKESYRKNNPSVYQQLKIRQSDAIRNAKFAYSQASADEEANPSTEVYQLVEDLLNLKK